MTCQACGGPVPQARYGPTRRTCSPKCRTRVYRMRRASQPVDLEPVEPAEPVTVTWPTAPPASASPQWPARTQIVPEPAPAMERLAAAIQLLREVRTVMLQLAGGRLLSDSMAVRAEHTGDQLDTCLREVWGIGERTTR